MADYSSCVELACKLNSQPEMYTAFKNAMSSGSGEFASWLGENGVPTELASAIANSEGSELFNVIGEAICERFW